jgi:hypothetical protein
MRNDGSKLAKNPSFRLGSKMAMKKVAHIRCRAGGKPIVIFLIGVIGLLWFWCLNGRVNLSEGKLPVLGPYSEYVFDVVGCVRSFGGRISEHSLHIHERNTDDKVRFGRRSNRSWIKRNLYVLLSALEDRWTGNLNVHRPVLTTAGVVSPTIRHVLLEDTVSINSTRWTLPVIVGCSKEALTYQALLGDIANNCDIWSSLQSRIESSQPVLFNHLVALLRGYVGVPYDCSQGEYIKSKPIPLKSMFLLLLSLPFLWWGLGWWKGLYDCPYGILGYTLASLSVLVGVMFLLIAIQRLTIWSMPT